LKVYAKGNELERMILSPMDVVYVCEHGLDKFIMPKLENGEEIEVIPEDPYKLPEIELKHLDVPEMQDHIWEKDMQCEDEIFKAKFE